MAERQSAAAAGSSLLKTKTSEIGLTYYGACGTWPAGAYEADVQPKRKDMAADKKSEKKDDPCWKGYEQVGMKEKDGKQVPNCVPENKKSDGKGKS